MTRSASDSALLRRVKRLERLVIALVVSFGVFAGLLALVYIQRGPARSYYNQQFHNFACVLVQFTPPGDELGDQLRSQYRCPPYHRPRPSSTPPATTTRTSTKTVTRSIHAGAGLATASHTPSAPQRPRPSRTPRPTPTTAHRTASSAPPATTHSASATPPARTREPKPSARPSSTTSTGPLRRVVCSLLSALCRTETP